MSAHRFAGFWELRAENLELRNTSSKILRYRATKSRHDDISNSSLPISHFLSCNSARSHLTRQIRPHNSARCRFTHQMRPFTFARCCFTHQMCPFTFARCRFTHQMCPFTFARCCFTHQMCPFTFARCCFARQMRPCIWQGDILPTKCVLALLRFPLTTSH